MYAPNATPPPRKKGLVKGLLTSIGDVPLDILDSYWSYGLTKSTHYFFLGNKY